MKKERRRNRLSDDSSEYVEEEAAERNKTDDKRAADDKHRADVVDPERSEALRSAVDNERIETDDNGAKSKDCQIDANVLKPAPKITTLDERSETLKKGMKFSASAAKPSAQKFDTLKKSCIKKIQQLKSPPPESAKQSAANG